MNIQTKEAAANQLRNELRQAWIESAAAIIAAQNARRPFSYYNQTLPVWQRRGRPTNHGPANFWR